MSTPEPVRPKGFSVHAWYLQCGSCGYPWYQHQVNGTPACNCFSLSVRHNRDHSNRADGCPTVPKRRGRAAAAVEPPMSKELVA